MCKCVKVVCKWCACEVSVYVLVCASFVLMCASGVQVVYQCVQVVC